MTRATRWPGLLLMIACALGWSSAALAQSAPDPQQKAFEDGKALGRSQAGPVSTGVRDGSASTTVPNYTTDPPQKGYWGTQDFNSPLAAQQAQCASTPNDPLCAGVATGSQPRPAYPVSMSDPALAGADAAIPALFRVRVRSHYRQRPSMHPKTWARGSQQAHPIHCLSC